MYTQGIDVASDQGQIAWERVKEAGIGFAYLKATEGLERDGNQPHRRRYFETNWPQIQEAGLARGPLPLLPRQPGLGIAGGRLPGGGRHIG